MLWYLLPLCTNPLLPVLHCHIYFFSTMTMISSCFLVPFFSSLAHFLHLLSLLQDMCLCVLLMQLLSRDFSRYWNQTCSAIMIDHQRVSVFPHFCPSFCCHLRSIVAGQNIRLAVVDTTTFHFLQPSSPWCITPTSLISLMLSTAPKSKGSGLKLQLSTNHINYINPWKTDHFMSMWSNQSLSPNNRCKKLLT